MNTDTSFHPLDSLNEREVRSHSSCAAFVRSASAERAQQTRSSSFATVHQLISLYISLPTQISAIARSSRAHVLEQSGARVIKHLTIALVPPPKALVLA
jgi:hypothetical protein